METSHSEYQKIRTLKNSLKLSESKTVPAIAPVLTSKPAQHTDVSCVPADTLLRYGNRFTSSDAGSSANAAYALAQAALDAFKSDPSAQNLGALTRQVKEARECSYVYTHKLAAEGHADAMYDTEKKFQAELQRPETIQQFKNILNPQREQAKADVEKALGQVLEVSQQMNAADRPQHIDWSAEYRRVSNEHHLARSRDSHLAQISHMLLGSEGISRL